jgi:cellulose synthase/poly-beta-1,6-N-acetylglucosamine synthase-like glycosyltransferase
MIPVLFVTYNRLEYTKESLGALFNCKNKKIFIVDNGSTDGTVEWLKSQNWKIAWDITLNAINIGIAGAMNQFLEKTRHFTYVGKVDNDTIVPPDWIDRMLPHMALADVVQSKHPLIKASGVGTFDEWVSHMPANGPLRFNHFVGGSGIIFRRSIVDRVPVTEWKLGGWRQWQRDNPQFKKAFATDVSIKLLDTDESGANYSKYPEYYKETGRTC